MTSKIKQTKQPAALLNKRDPRAKFVELANMRVARAIKDLRLIGNLSNRRNYDYSDAESKRIIKTLEVELEDLKAKFRGKQNDSTELFKL
jgi:hypothetical protein